QLPASLFVALCALSLGGCGVAAAPVPTPAPTMRPTLAVPPAPPAMAAPTAAALSTAAPTPRPPAPAGTPRAGGPGGGPAATVPSLATVTPGPQPDLIFAVQADPHMDEQSSPTVYKQTLQGILDARPAFLIDLGDIFMIDKLNDKSEAAIRERYVLMKGYYDLLGSLPLHLVMGNHDGEAGWDKPNARPYRAQYFPAQTGPKNYYAFEQGGALFVVLDPFAYTTVKPNTDGWKWTLGREQYDWLRRTLESSKASHKFVFIHQLVGGDDQGRGGVELARNFEWGGNNPDGGDGFEAHRPGWGKPLQQLFIDTGIDIIFKGHDHFYARQELDGIVYQTVPQPSHPGDRLNTTDEYGYTNGRILGGSGFLKVSVFGTAVTVEFVRADGKIADRYTIP
ncbi:MAG: metallophosphoesterase, partial [Thermoflexales bacterium]|nr:metallophosphoesterase [Thermoflexales bacterium]